MQCRQRNHQKRKGGGGGGGFCVDFDACVRQVRTRRNVPKVSSPLSDKFSLCLYTLICRLIVYRVHTHHVRCEEEHVDTFLRDDGLCYLEPGIGHNGEN